MRSAVIRLLLVLSLAISGTLLGCHGGSSNTVVKLVLSPATLSLSPGDVLQVTASAQNPTGGVVASATVTYAVTNGNVITVSTSGLVCAGTWDSLTTPINCKPGGLGTATLTASTASGASTITSNSVPVNVHAKIDRITVAALIPAGANSVPACISEGATAPANTLQYQATAFSGGTVVCGAPPNPSCGAFTWNTSNSSVAVISSTQPANQDPSQITITAGKPGTANVFASVSGVTSLPVSFTTCAIASIAAHASGGQATSFTLNTGATQQLAADVLDSQGVAVPTPPITWNSSQPHVASVGASTGLVTASNPGTVSISVSCTPPNCNVGLNAVYGNLNLVMVSGTSAQTVYATTTAAPASGSNNSIIPIDNNTAGTAIALPAGDSVNSLVFNLAGSAGYVGSESGLFGLTTSTNVLSSPVTAVTGKVLTVSPDGLHIVVSDAANPDPAKRVVYIFNPTSGVIEATLPISNATAAAYSPDMFKLFIVGGSTLYVYTGVSHPIALAGVGNDVDVLASGHVALVAVQLVGDDVFAVCNNQLFSPVNTGSPAFVRGIPNGTGAVDVAAPEVHQFDISVGGACPPTFTNSAPSPYTFGNLAAFTPSQLLMTPDSSRAIVLSDQGVLVYHIGATATAGSTSVITLSNGAQPTTGGVTLDSTTLYVGGTDNAVHRIDLTANNGAGADLQSIPLPFSPDLVGISPK